MLSKGLCGGGDNAILWVVDFLVVVYDYIEALLRLRLFQFGILALLHSRSMNKSRIWSWWTSPSTLVVYSAVESWGCRRKRVLAFSLSLSPGPGAEWKRKGPLCACPRSSRWEIRGFQNSLCWIEHVDRFYRKFGGKFVPRCFFCEECSFLWISFL